MYSTRWQAPHVTPATLSPPPVTLRIAKEDMKFSAAHFTIFGEGSREALHGHDHFVIVEITGVVGENGLLAGVNYAEFKRLVRELCIDWDEKTLLPGRSAHLRVAAQDNEVIATFGTEEMRFPAAEVVVIPSANTSLEALAEVFSARLAAALARESFGSGLRDLALTVTGSPGQQATVRRTFREQ